MEETVIAAEVYLAYMLRTRDIVNARDVDKVAGRVDDLKLKHDGFSVLLDIYGDSIRDAVWGHPEIFKVSPHHNGPIMKADYSEEFYSDRLRRDGNKTYLDRVYGSQIPEFCREQIIRTLMEVDNG